MAKVGFAVPIRLAGGSGDQAPFAGSGEPVPARETVWNRIRDTGAAASPGSVR